MKKPMVIKCKGSLPPARFGHSSTQISNNQVIIFGGAYLSNDQHKMIEETYMFDIVKSEWFIIKSIFH